MRRFEWQLDQDSSESTTSNAKSIRFGDGYEQMVSFGINKSRKTWQASVTDKKAVIDEIYRFLLSTDNVEVFSITPVPDEPAIKVRNDGEITRNKLGGNVWRVTFNLKQVF